MKLFKLTLIAAVALCTGIVIGGFLFSRTIPRSFLTVHQCEDCFKTKEIAGLLASLGIQNLGGALPKVIYETDKTLVFDIQYPYPPDKIHYLVAPKRDIKNVDQLTEEDRGYIDEAYIVMGKIVRDNHYAKYRVITNGPGYQEVAYLHFHLVIDRD